MRPNDPVASPRLARHFGASPGELLSLERSAELARPMRWLDAGAHDRIAQAAREWIAGWRDDWDPMMRSGGVADAVSCVALSAALGVADHAAPVWRALGDASHDAGPWWTWGGDMERRDDARMPEDLLREAWFESRDDRCDGLAAELAHAAWTDWGARALEWIGTVPADRLEADGVTPSEARAPRALPASMLHSWSGAACLQVAWGGRTLSVAVDGARVERWLARDGAPAVARPRAELDASRSMVPLAAAIREVRVGLRVELSSVEIDLGDLMSLSTGDVVRTRHALDQPLYVSTVAPDGDGSDVFCRAYLGSREGALAIVMVDPSPRSG